MVDNLTTDHPELLVALRAIVGERGLLTGEDVLARSCDPFRAVPPAGGVIVRPASTEEVSRILALCSARGQRVVIHGGCTGVAGGAYAGPDELVLSLERMTGIEEIDPVGQFAVVQSGAPLQSLQDAVAAQGLLYPIDLGSKGSATIGGTIATNAGGNRVLRWGMTRQNILGVEAVLSDGTIVSSMNSMIKNNSGYDLKHLFVGTEGTLGIVTRAVLRLVPAPNSQAVAFVSVPGFPQLLSLLGSARKLMCLSAFEVMWRDYYEMMAASDTGRQPVPSDQPYYVLIESMGYDEEVDSAQFQAFLERAYDAGWIAEAVTASSARQIADLWRVREGADIIVREMSPFVSFDVSVDVRSAEDFVVQVREAVARDFPGARTIAFGHLGDNNIHFGVHAGPETTKLEQQIERCVYAVVGRFSGALTAEHGVGQFKRAFLPDHRTPAEMDVMHRLRDALDQPHLLNRDVLF